jgi:two-component system cell cycle response regulator DivK
MRKDTSTVTVQSRPEPKTVLAVDDNELNLKLFSRVLVPHGYRVLEARTGEECLEILRKERPHVVLMDVKLPGMSGLDATRIMKTDPALAGIPVIVVTAYAMEEDRMKAFEAGCVEFMTKPFHVRELVDAVRRVAGE